MDAQCRKAQVVIVEQTIAAEQLPALQKEDGRSETLAIVGGSRTKSNSTTAVTLVPRQTDAIARFQNSLTSIQDASQRQALVLQHSTQLLHNLLQQWTHLDQPEEISVSTPANSSSSLSKDDNNAAWEVRGPQEQFRSATPAQRADILEGRAEKLRINDDTAETQQRPAYLQVQAGQTGQPATTTPRHSSRYASNSGEKIEVHWPDPDGLSRSASVRQPTVDSNHHPSSSPSDRSQAQKAPPPRHRSLSPGSEASAFIASSSDYEAFNIRDTQPRARPRAKLRAPRAGATTDDGLEGYFPSSNYAHLNPDDYYKNPRSKRRKDYVPSEGQNESQHKDSPQSKPPRRRKSGKTEQSSVPLIAHAANLAGMAAVLGMKRRNQIEARKRNEMKTSTGTKKPRSWSKRTPYAKNQASYDSDPYDSYYDSEASLEAR